MPRAKIHIITEIIAALLILLFTYTAASKLLSINRFQFVLVELPLIARYASFMAYFIPAVELITSLLLLLPRTRITGFYASTVLMIGFTGYIGYMIVYTPDLPCSCGGVIKQLTWSQHLVLNFFFLALSITAIVLNHTNKIFIAINRRSRTPV